MMRYSFVGLSAAMLVACGSQAPANLPESAAQASTEAPAALTLEAADGVTVHALHYRAVEPKALVLLFHQAGSSKGEYATIAPRLVQAGYSALAIDQRSGGGMFGPNLTAQGLGRDAPYQAALPDLQAALDWAGGQGLSVIVWGSSYSSSLVFALAAENQGKVRGVLAFSPGEYFDDPMFVREAAAKVTVPVFVTSASGAEVGEARSIFDAVAATDKLHLKPIAGVHGSSTLIPARNAAGAEDNWQAVLEFLGRTIT